jgi:hypothetical protein
MQKDTRHALGNGSEDDFAANELPMKFPFEYSPKRPPLPGKMGMANPAINERRPIARMNPDGEGDIQEGLAFRRPMGEPYDD